MAKAREASFRQSLRQVQRSLNGQSVGLNRVVRLNLSSVVSNRLARIRQSKCEVHLDAIDGFGIRVRMNSGQVGEDLPPDPLMRRTGDLMGTNRRRGHLEVFAEPCLYDSVPVGCRNRSFISSADLCV